MEILVLKTNIRFKKQLKAVAPLLDGHVNIIRWNLDLQDRDRVLRIESDAMPLPDIVQLVQRAGFYCEELCD